MTDDEMRRLEEAARSLFEGKPRVDKAQDPTDRFDWVSAEQTKVDPSLVLDRSQPPTVNQLNRLIEICQDLARDAEHQSRVAGEMVAMGRDLMSHAGAITAVDMRFRDMHQSFVDKDRKVFDLLSVVYKGFMRMEQIAQVLGLPEPDTRQAWYPRSEVAHRDAKRLADNEQLKQLAEMKGRVDSMATSFEYLDEVKRIVRRNEKAERLPEIVDLVEEVFNGKGDGLPEADAQDSSQIEPDRLGDGDLGAKGNDR